MKALIICHKTKDDIGVFKDVLIERGFDLDIHLGHHDVLADNKIDVKDHDVTIYMGGPMGVYQADMFPYLYNEIKYLEKRLEAGLPYLGICLGAQLMAKAMGENVYAGAQGKEVGWCEVNVNEAGMNTAVKHLDISKTKMMQWHGDTYDRPREATLLASSDLYENQAMAYGDHAIGLQCHPEITTDISEFWLSSGIKDAREMGLSIPDIRAECKENLPTLNAQAKAFLNDWLDNVTGS